MSDTIYADGIGAVMIRDGVARVDLMRVVQGEGEKVALNKTGTLAISLPGLVRMHQDLSRVIQKLIDDGVLQKREETTERPASKAAKS